MSVQLQTKHFFERKSYALGDDVHFFHNTPFVKQFLVIVECGYAAGFEKIYFPKSSE